ncbi:MAG: hypothetical protein IT308_07155 [Anaerolineaceae bacterium]|nr:hypothetical protein [Anaerolineaceae bacterium]
MSAKWVSRLVAIPARRFLILWASYRQNPWVVVWAAVRFSSLSKRGAKPPGKAAIGRRNELVVFIKGL